MLEINSRLSILYVYPEPLIHQAGGERVNLRNRELLELTCDNVTVYEIPKTVRLQTFLRLAEGFCGGISHGIVNDIFSILDKGRHDAVFLWSSKAGKLAKMISRRYPRIKIITFFHNIEIQYAEEELKLSPSLKNRFISRIVCQNELDAVNYSSSLIVMNDRDNRLLDKYYNAKANLILPLGMTDSYCKEVNCSRFSSVGSKLKLLFVGSAFFANIDGVKWFINHVFPHLTDVELLIAGKGMDCQFTPINDSDRNASVSVMGYVDRLDEVYEWAHIVVSPIFHGGGMKTKTAEAMMYGCPIVGTEEAFEGYDIEYDKIGARCNTPKEFIDAIGQLRNSKEHLLNSAKYSRITFLEKYDTNVLKNKMTDFLRNVKYPT